MSKVPGIERAEIQALPRVSDRMSFLYLEHCVVNRNDGAVTVSDVRGTVHVPAAGIGVLLLGPGTKVTHRAMELLGDAGVSVLWVGEQGVRYYAHGRPLTHSSRLLERQAELVCNVRSRVAVARRMYALRFPGEDVSMLSMQQLRGREGSRVRRVYRECAQQFGVSWSGRSYEMSGETKSTKVNQALSTANSCLYGVVHSVIVALGCSPGLGFIHCGKARSFVYDIADLYKAELSIPVAFEVASSDAGDKTVEIERVTRKMMRDRFKETKILERCVRDIKMLFSAEEPGLDLEVEILELWDDKCGHVAYGRNYGTANEDFCEDVSSDDAGYGLLLDGPE